MTITKVISYFISLAMISVILWAQNQTSLFDSIIPTLPWGIVSLVDLYSGFILIGIWMIYQKKKSTHGPFLNSMVHYMEYIFMR